MYSFNGAATAQVLAALLNQERTALEISSAVARATGGRVQIPTGQIYTQLQRMEKSGLIQGYYDASRDGERGGRPRRYYRITAEGRRVIADLDLIRGAIA